MHITTKSISPSLLKTQSYVNSEDLYCRANDVGLHTSSYEQDGWSVLEGLWENMDKLDYKGYTVCERCLEHPEVALYLLGEL